MNPEFKVFEHDSDEDEEPLETRLNRLYGQGWDLVSVVDREPIMYLICRNRYGEGS